MTDTLHFEPAFDPFCPHTLHPYRTPMEEALLELASNHHEWPPCIRKALSSAESARGELDKYRSTLTDDEFRAEPIGNIRVVGAEAAAEEALGGIERYCGVRTWRDGDERLVFFGLERDVKLACSIYAMVERALEAFSYEGEGKLSQVWASAMGRMLTQAANVADYERPMRTASGTIYAALRRWQVDAAFFGFGLDWP